MNSKLGNYDINVKIVYKKNRNIYFRFDNNLSLIVTCPKNTLNDEIASLITKNEKALLKMYEKAKDIQKYDSEFWFLGNKYNVVYDEKITDVKLENDNIYTKDETMLNDYVNNQIDKIFNEEVNICKKCFAHLPKFTLRLRKMKTRWGVCNRKDNIITLNTELIKKKVELLDYVIIHEMAHFYEGNHSKNFWAIVEKACPNYKQRRADLRK